MRRYSFILWILIIYLSTFGGILIGSGAVGGGSSLQETIDDDGTGSQIVMRYSDTYYAAGSWTAASSYTADRVDVYLEPVNDPSGYTYHVRICDDNSGDPYPNGANCDLIGTITGVSSTQNYTATGSGTHTITSSNTYWIKIHRSDGSGDETNCLYIYFNTSTPTYTIKKDSDDSGSWSTIGTYDIRAQIWGY